MPGCRSQALKIALILGIGALAVAALVWLVETHYRCIAAVLLGFLLLVVGASGDGPIDEFDE